MICNVLEEYTEEGREKEKKKGRDGEPRPFPLSGNISAYSSAVYGVFNYLIANYHLMQSLNF